MDIDKLQAIMERLDVIETELIDMSDEEEKGVAYHRLIDAAVNVGEAVMYLGQIKRGW